MRQLGLFDRPAPAQPKSQGSQAGADYIEDHNRRGRIADRIIQVLRDAGPEGLTVEELTTRINERFAADYKETSIYARVSGRNEMRNWVSKSPTQRENPKTKIRVAVFVLNDFIEKQNTERK